MVSTAGAGVEEDVLEIPNTAFQSSSSLFKSLSLDGASCCFRFNFSFSAC